MWALFSTRLRRWLLFVIGAPVLAKVLHRAADWLEVRRGTSSKAAGALRSSGNLVAKVRGGRRRRRRFFR